jgi:phospholipid transport system substrate-binding protein
MKRPWGLTAICILVLGVVLPAGAVAPQDPAAVVTSLGNEALKVLGPNVAPNLRVARFRQLFQTDFNVPGIARFVLGRYWRLATPAQQQEFITLFTNYIALVYANQLAQYNGETLRVTGTRSAPDGELVSSEIIRTNGQPPARVDWLLNPLNGSYKISDVIFEGVSMAVTQRSEFASVIQRHGGQVQSLITALEQKTEGAGAR